VPMASGVADEHGMQVAGGGQLKAGRLSTSASGKGQRSKCKGL